MTVAPARLEGVPSDILPAKELKTGVRVTHVRPRDVAKNVWLAAASGAGTGASQTLEFEIGFLAVIPLHRQFVADELNVFWLKSHGTQRNPHRKKINYGTDGIESACFSESRLKKRIFIGRPD